MYVVNLSRGTYLGVDVKRASSFGARMLGLYLRHNLALGDGVWLVPCKGIQTIGMKIAIDVIFLDAEQRVVRVDEQVRPGRVIWWVRQAHSALEVPAGAVQSSETQVGDRVQLATTLPAGLTETRGVVREFAAAGSQGRVFSLTFPGMPRPAGGEAGSDNLRPAGNGQGGHSVSS